MGFLGNYLLNLPPVVLGRQPVRPLLFSYYVTHRCRWNCVYCSDGEGKRFKEEPVPELTAAEVARLFLILREATDTLDITGGEPLERPDLEEILTYAREKGFRIVLNTRGPGLPDRPKLMQLVDVLVLSVDALNPVKTAEIMGGDGFAAKEALEALRFAMTARRQNSVQLVISAVATPHNLEEIRRVLQLAAENSLGFHLSPQIVGTTVHPQLRNHPSYRDLIKECLQAKRRGVKVLGVSPYFRGIRDFHPFRCYPLLMPTIRPDGRMYYPCLESKQAEVSILESGSYRVALTAVQERRGPIPNCSDRCHIFCHMALSLLQRHPLAALGEHRNWRS